MFQRYSPLVEQKGKNLEGLDKETKESLSVAVCNGAVHEPTPKMK